MHKITHQIQLFRDFLVGSWPFVDDLMSNHDWDDDGNFIDEWLQVNWEFFVERELLKKNGHLTTFNIFPNLKRISSSDKQPTHTIIAKSKSDCLLKDIQTGKKISEGKTLRLCSFSSLMKQNTFGLYPPFDVANLRNDLSKQVFYVLFDELDFYLIMID